MNSNCLFFLVNLMKQLYIINATQIKQRTTKHFLSIANPQNLESKSGKKIIRPFEKGFKLNIE